MPVIYYQGLVRDIHYFESIYLLGKDLHMLRHEVVACWMIEYWKRPRIPKCD